MLSISMMRRWSASTVNTKALSYAFYRFNLQLRERLAVGCGSAAGFCCISSYVPKPFKSVALLTAASVLSRSYSCLSSAASRIIASEVANRRSPVVAGTDATHVHPVRSITTVRVNDESRIKVDARGGVRRLRQPKRLSQ